MRVQGKIESLMEQYVQRLLKIVLNKEPLRGGINFFSGMQIALYGKI